MVSLKKDKYIMCLLNSSLMEFFVGTSGWSYGWNEGNSLEWYVHHSGLNAVELNMSFYRFPYPNMVTSWSRKGKQLAWVVKVHRSITHHKKLGKESYALFERFQQIFKPLEESIHYYLVQLPPSFDRLDVLDAFVDACNSEKLCIECRHRSLFTDEIMQWGEKKGVLLVSVDAPDMPRRIMNTRVVYERVHGRTGWYSHDYSGEELLDIKKRIVEGNPERVYVFFNNNHAMLDNGRAMYDLLLGKRISTR
jgi:uncharacterized protein YecE (DUF72 family)